MSDKKVSKQKSGKKNRKHGRNGRTPSMAAYRAEMRWEKNKKRRVLRHWKRTKRSDKQALAWLHHQGVSLA